MKFQVQKLEVSYTSVVILRIMLSLIFIVASTNHFFNIEKVVGRMENAHMGFLGSLLGTPETVVMLSGIVMVVAGVALLIGFKTRYAAMLLIAVLIPITLTVQVGQMATMGPLFKNVAILGGLLFFSINSNLKIQKQ
ncbi:DoxX family protein [Mariniflexile sp. AS56]|uniref:DoxX family protein n=1 Tax=Mariniflexile sp. AS56 TaxID=3063957 RepID=UPI0026F34525|nr:DoxX family protein [Mariniflexile sp. AS56]MDO7174215.1 DoxX family protein [Mariniflexile sp. AS56]